MVLRLYRALCGCICLCSSFMVVTPSPAWSASDKTVVDLERGLPEAPSRYHRPRGAQRYRFDETEVDIAVPLVRQAPGEQQTPTPAPPAATPGTLFAPVAPPSSSR